MVPTWYIRERCPNFVYLPAQTQQDWLLLLGAEFNSTRMLSAVDPVHSWGLQQAGDGMSPQEVQEETDPDQRMANEGPLVSLTVPLTWSVTSVQIHWSIQPGEVVPGQAEPARNPGHRACEN